MVLRLRQHNIGYTADGFYRSDDPTNSVKALKEGGWMDKVNWPALCTVPLKKWLGCIWHPV